MKKIVRNAVIISVIMIAGFAAFLYKMGESSRKIKDELARNEGEDSNIVSLQEGQFALNIPPDTEINELIVAGDGANVLLFENDGAEDIYTVEHSGQIHDQLARMQSKKEYTFDAPLLAYNPYGTNACGLYIYFETDVSSRLKYTVSVPDENIPDFTKTMKDEEINGRKAYEYLLTGLVPGKENYLRLRLMAEDGREIENRVYKIMMPESAYGNAVSIPCTYTDEVSNISHGLFFVYGCGTKSIPVYDNAGYLRGEIPLIKDNGICVNVREASMYIAPSGSLVAKLSSAGQVVSVVSTGDYVVGPVMDYTGMGQMIAIASGKGRKTKGDVIISVDIESGQVSERVDVKKLLKKYYAKYVKGTGKAKWLDVNSIKFFDNGDVIICAPGISSIVKIDNIMSRNPAVNYVIGDSAKWTRAGMADKLLTKTDAEDTETDDMAPGGEGEEEEATEEPVIDSILDDDVTDGPFGNSVNQTGALPYVSSQVKDVVDEDGSFVAVTSYYLSTISGNDGESSEYWRYKIDEEARTLSLTRSTAITAGKGGGSLSDSGVNLVVMEPSSGCLYEFDVNGRIYIQLGIHATGADKYSMIDYWFR